MRAEPNAHQERFGTIAVEVNATTHSDVRIARIAVVALAEPAATPVAERVFPLSRRAKIDVPATVVHLGQVAKRRQIGVSLKPRKQVGVARPSTATQRYGKGRHKQQKESHQPPSSRAPTAECALLSACRNLAAVSMQLQRGSTKPPGRVTTCSERVAPDFTK